MLTPRFGFVIGTLCVSGLLANAAWSDASGASADASGARADTARAVPFNITVDPRLDDIVARMMERSPTFRDQIRDLGSVPHVRVQLIMRVSYEPFGQSAFRAESNMRRYRYGRIEAMVRLLSQGHAVELIAHELEHVREYVAGTNFRLLAARQGSGVWEAASGHFETARAVAMGQRVAEEVQPRTTASH